MDILDKLKLHYSEVTDTLSKGKPGQYARSDLDTIEKKLINNYRVLDGSSSIDDIISILPIAGISTKVLGKSAYSAKEIYDLGKKIKDKGAKAAHTVRGQIGYAATDSNVRSSAEVLDDYISNINRFKYLEDLGDRSNRLGISDKFNSKYRKELNNIINMYMDYGDELFSKQEITKLVKPSKMILDKPIYLQRIDGLMMNKQAKPSLDDLVSTTVVDPKNIKSHYGTEVGNLDNIIYKLPKGESIYNTLNRADTGEVLTTRRALSQTKDKMQVDKYSKLMKKGLAPFALGGLMAQEDYVNQR